MMPSRGLWRVALVLPVAILSVVPVPAGADDPVKPRAAVVVSAAEGTDPFVTAYLSEVGAQVLREAGFEVAPPNAARAALIRMERGALECAADDACVSRFARQVAAPTLLFVETIPLTTDRISVSVAAVTVRHGAIERTEPSSGEGGEAQMAEPVQAAARALGSVELPCHVELAPSAGLEVALAISSGTPVDALPVFLAAGQHELVLSARGRAEVRTTLTCVAGRRYRVRVR